MTSITTPSKANMLLQRQAYCNLQSRKLAGFILDFKVAPVEFRQIVESLAVRQNERVRRIRALLDSYAWHSYAPRQTFPSTIQEVDGLRQLVT